MDELVGSWTVGGFQLIRIPFEFGTGSISDIAEMIGDRQQSSVAEWAAGWRAVHDGVEPLLVLSG